MASFVFSVGHDRISVLGGGFTVGHIGEMGGGLAEGREMGHLGVMAAGSSVGFKEATEGSVGHTCCNGTLVVG